LRRVGLPLLRQGRGLSPPVRNFTAPENSSTVRRHGPPRQRDVRSTGSFAPAAPAPGA